MATNKLTAQELLEAAARAGVAVSIGCENPGVFVAGPSGRMADGGRTTRHPTSRLTC